MNSLPKLIISIGLMFIFGCASGPSQLVWNKPGGTQQDFNRDHYDCLQQAQQRESSTYVGPYGGVASDNVSTNERLLYSCLSARGWSAQNRQDAERQTRDRQMARQQAPERAAQQSQPKPNPLKDKLEELSQESRNICAREEYKLLAIKSTCKADDLSFEQLADKSKISALEKPLLSKYLAEDKAINKRRIDILRSDGGPKGVDIAQIIEHFERLQQNNAFRLCEEHISWGEFNKRRKEIVQKVRDEIKEIIKSK